MEEIVVQEKKRVLYLTLNRPGKRNALTAAMCNEIVQRVRNIQERVDIGAVLIAAHGPVFCSGMDLEEVRDEQGFDLEQVHEELFTMGRNSLKPIVVAVGGAALGGGLGLVAQGHIVMASEFASFALPEIKIGFWPFLVFRAVEHAIGSRRTLELSLTGCKFHPNDGAHWGLVHRVCPATEIFERSETVARELAKASPMAIRAGLQYVRDARGKSSEEAGEIAAKLRVQVMAGDDFKEGVAAFQQKREARWPSLPENFYREKVS
jgi:enoyl-CoA hydratase/carnithine racemase